MIARTSKRVLFVAGCQVTLLLTLAAGIAIRWPASSSVAAPAEDMPTAGASKKGDAETGRTGESNDSADPEVTPQGRSWQAMATALKMKGLAEPATATRLPTAEEYLVSAWKMALSDDKTNEAEAHYRIGWSIWIGGPHPKYATDALAEAVNEFGFAAGAFRGDSKYIYWYLKSEIELAYENGKEPDLSAGSRLDTIYKILVEKDLRYYVHKGEPHSLDIDFLVLLLEEEKYTQLALAELKALPRDGLATLLGHLKYPHCGYRVESLLLEAIAGREHEILPEAREILHNLQTVQIPRLDRYERALLISEVDAPTEAEAESLLGSRRWAHRIRGAQVSAVADRTREAHRYLASRVEWFQDIVARGSVGGTAR